MPEIVVTPKILGPREIGALLGLPDAFCKNTGHLVNSARSKLCRNS